MLEFKIVAVKELYESNCQAGAIAEKIKTLHTTFMNGRNNLEQEQKGLHTQERLSPLVW